MSGLFNLTAAFAVAEKAIEVFLQDSG